MTKREPYIGADGEVRDLDDAFFAKARRGRPPMLPTERKVRVNLMIEPDLARELDLMIGPAEYLAVTRLQADALVTVDPDLARTASGVVAVADVEDLGRTS